MLILLVINLLFNTQSNITLSLTDIRSAEGTIRIAFYDNEEQFLKTPTFSISEPVSDMPAQQIILEQIPVGEYAIAVFHDRNNNGEMDKNLLGIPTESFGFSNNKMGFASPPSFKQCLVKITQPDTRLSIDLINY